MGTQGIMYVLIGYYVFLAIGIGVLGAGGMLDSTASMNTNSEIHSFTVNESTSLESPPTTSTFGVSQYFQSVWNFAFSFDVNLGVGAWVWVIRLIFVYLPATFTILAIVFALPFMGGH